MLVRAPPCIVPWSLRAFGFRSHPGIMLATYLRATLRISNFTARC